MRPFTVAAAVPLAAAIVAAAVGAGAVLAPQDAPSAPGSGVAPRANALAQFLAASNLVSPLGSVEILEDGDEHEGFLDPGDWVRDEAPRTAAQLIALCPPGAAARDHCLTDALGAVMEARGPEAAFTLFEEASAADGYVGGQAHRLAHVLGRHALVVYGDVGAAMQHCSYKVFAGCFHGALQAHFEQLPVVSGEALHGLCPTDNLFREYTCLHGAGHGLFLATFRDLPASLAMCGVLPTDFGRSSCWGGAFMENVVGYFDSLSGASHDHGPAGELKPYMVDRADPQYPCNAVDAATRATCWMMQTSLILHYNAGNFRATASVCDAVQDHRLLCYRSLGRDAAPYTGRNTAQAVQHCSTGQGEARAECMRGYVAESVLHYASPDAGLAVCRTVPDVDKAPCYNEVGSQGRQMDADMDAVCGGAEPAFTAACRQGAGLA